MRFMISIILILFLILSFSACQSEPKPFPPPEGYSSWEEYNEEHARREAEDKGELYIPPAPEVENVPPKLDISLPSEKSFEPIILSGIGDKTTPPFEITTDEWIIEWSYIIDPEYAEYFVFGFFIYPRGETMLYVEAVLFIDEPQGSTYSYAGQGEYYADVSAYGLENWEITIKPVS